MTVEDIGKTIQDMQKEMKSMKHELERLQAVHEIQNIVGTYAAIHGTNEWKSVELFSKRDDVSAEIAMWGKVIGQEKIKSVWPKHEAPKGPDGKPMTMPPGGMVEHQFTTPLIEVAADGQTAKGIWFSPGHETTPGKDGKPIANWCWGRYGADFIKEDGKWKIWHWHWYDTFMCPYDKSWVDYPQPAPDVVLHPPGLDPDSPPTVRSSYFPDRNRIELPYPVPYETWDGKSAA